jgi:hypothetical protein
MKFKKDILMFNKENYCFFFGDKAALKVSGPVRDDLAHCVEAGSSYTEIFNKFPASDDLSSIIAIINEFLSDNEPALSPELVLVPKAYQLDKNNVIEVIDLNPSNELPSTFEVYAKNFDPTAVVGVGGYDDDLPSM